MVQTPSGTRVNGVEASPKPQHMLAPIMERFLVPVMWFAAGFAVAKLMKKAG
jgi:hypothetical protein